MTRQWRGSAAEAERIEVAFPSLAGALARPEGRRTVLRLMAASAALGGLGGCDASAPDGHYQPAVNQAANIVPGLPNRYATALVDGGAACGIVVRHDMGRPVGVAGNPAHPGSLGSTSIYGQSVLLDFYDPDRAGSILNRGEAASVQALLRDLVPLRAAMAGDGGEGLRVLTGRVVSPTLGAQIGALLARYPKAHWVQWEPVGRDAVRQGTVLAYGRPLDLLPRVANADVVLGLDSDLIGGAPGHLRHARDFAARRNPTRGAAMSRVYAAEPIPTLLGGVADHRFVAGPREVAACVNALAATVLGGAPGGDAPPWVAAVVRDLQSAGRRALVHAGPDLPVEQQALVHQVNERLGARGTTFDLIEPVAVRSDDEAGGFAALLDDMREGQVRALVILDANPAYAAGPAFREALRRVPWSLLSSPAPDETADLVTWYVPGVHLFEAWGDLRAHDGTCTIQQPQALPLYGGRSAFDVLALFGDAVSSAPRDSLDVVRAAWRDRLDDAAWEDALADGVVPGTASAPVVDKPLAPKIPDLPAAQSLTLLVRPDPNLGDGRHANNAWLQELPRPIGKLVWDNPLLVSPALARSSQLEDGDVVELALDGQSVTMPVYVVPGQAPDCVAAWLGGGRTRAGSVGDGVGTDVTALRGLAGLPRITRTGRRVTLATTDHHNVLEVDRTLVDPVVRHGTLEGFQADPHLLLRDDQAPMRIYDHQPGAPVAWGMSVDLNACIGCNACVVACQAENNVPVVGPDQVRIGREMHWLRIDRYYEGPADAPQSFLQPMLCMHCENAPCEPVCPVEASVHDSEGLNLQVYNRCIGTRFCSNNCPYKVRRFNFGAWAAEEHRPDASRNPDVSVRSRGVMEKCTFCVQRIAAARIAHDRDGAKEEVVTACQAACPTQAFTFGDINDADSTVAARKRSPLTYALLPEANTRPRLTYEGRILNRNPALPA